MTAIRSFIAIELPGEIQARLNRIINQMKPELTGAVRWTPPGNIHLTIKFLGDVSPSNLEILIRVLQSLSSKQAEFEIKIGKIGAFPSIKRPRVIWVGVEASSALKALQQTVENETKKLGYPTEDRPFSPHLTLGRVNHHAISEEISRITETLSSIQVDQIGSFTVRHLTLFKSELKPGGAVYTPLLTTSFRQNHEVK